jgi:hypothetical protein
MKLWEWIAVFFNNVCIISSIFYKTVPFVDYTTSSYVDKVVFFINVGL